MCRTLLVIVRFIHSVQRTNGTSEGKEEKKYNQTTNKESTEPNVWRPDAVIVVYVCVCEWCTLVVFFFASFFFHFLGMNFCLMFALSLRYARHCRLFFPCWLTTVLVLTHTEADTRNIRTFTVNNTNTDAATIATSQFSTRQINVRVCTFTYTQDWNKKQWRRQH